MLHEQVPHLDSTAAEDINAGLGHGIPDAVNEDLQSTVRPAALLILAAARQTDIAGVSNCSHTHSSPTRMHAMASRFHDHGRRY